MAAVVIARLWHRRRDVPLADFEAQSHEMRVELSALRDELRDAQERLDFAERVLSQQRRGDLLPPEKGDGVDDR